MKLINQSFEILNQEDFSLIGIKKFIERCGRVCYKSEDRITDNSYERFVNMLESNHHDRPLEFGTVHLKIEGADTFDDFIDSMIATDLYHNIWFKYNYHEDTYYITINYRYYLQLKNKTIAGCFFTEEDNEYYPKRYTVHFITSRAIMDEFRTHVSLSHLAESTRFCSYNKDKFDNEITIIKPCYWDDLDVVQKQELVSSWAYCENSYLTLTNKFKLTAQKARDLLPLAIKSELISCGFKDAWDNFFYRRCAKDAHPMARELALNVQKKFNENSI